MAEKSDVVLRSSIVSAVLQTVFSVLFGLITFSLNAVILRYVAKDVLGVINVRMVLLQSTIIFFSRECFRKSCMKKAESYKEWKTMVNLIWLCVPIASVFSFLLCYLWIYQLDPPDNPVVAKQYTTAVILMGIANVLDAFTEVFWISCMTLLFVKFRSGLDFAYLATRSVAMVIIVIYYPERAVEGYCFLTVLVTIMVFTVHNLFFHFQIRVANELKKKSDGESNLIMSSLSDFYPDFSHPIHKDRLKLTLGFFKQGIFKQLLTEGERYMFTYFSLMSLAQQGIYDVVSAFGSMAARLIFSKVEEAAYFFFSQTVKRGNENLDVSTLKVTANHLKNLLRSMVLIGLIVSVFAQSYSHSLLHLYGGTKLSEGMGPDLLRGQSIFVLFMAINGVSECFAFAAMTTEQVDRYNFSMAFMSGIFLALTYIFAKLLGPLGFVVANCCNFAMRIAHSCLIIHKRYSGKKEVNHPLWGLIPSFGTIIIISASGIICKVSELQLYESDSPKYFLYHVIIGGICFLATVLQIVLSEQFVRDLLINALNRKAKAS